MGVEEGILAYTERMKSVFRDKIRNIPIDCKKFKKAIEIVINRTGLCPTDLINDGKPRRSKIFVCTTSEDTFRVARLRTYSVPNETALPVTICEAAFATSAATRSFDSVLIDSHQFVDGAFGANNPIEEVEEDEATDRWCATSRESKTINEMFGVCWNWRACTIPHK
ncbi:hypothetical protein PDIG_77640 [Penicillium digitatum PHI26]|uniref:PNPLA domain-containing protein n=2 Tax=Penicillium digitatum TaxID=36651 RepID=K9FE33_PEND2|nr:hypothetical protein PDIP_04750 [Penicillium digitatum Pd1]EKV06397.1 hypothetical protein PDIG_77640 [Penicillium digitatum PHI26]EKV21596.1 hypothetical protein PDIP_04750 [Penicillium digitatum Pd1]